MATTAKWGSDERGEVHTETLTREWRHGTNVDRINGIKPTDEKQEDR